MLGIVVGWPAIAGRRVDRMHPGGHGRPTTTTKLLPSLSKKYDWYVFKVCMFIFGIDSRPVLIIYVCMYKHY